MPGDRLAGLPDRASVGRSTTSLSRSMRRGLRERRAGWRHLGSSTAAPQRPALQILSERSLTHTDCPAPAADRDEPKLAAPYEPAHAFVAQPKRLRNFRNLQQPV